MVVLAIGKTTYLLTKEEAAQLGAKLAFQAELPVEVDGERSTPKGGIKLKLREDTEFYKAAFQLLNPYGDFS